MSQTWTDDVYGLYHTGTTDLQNMENNFAALKSSFSGSSSPGSPVPGQLWFDTAKKSLKVRNQAGSAWLACMYGNSNSKIWMYSNSTTDGWLSSSVTDCVLALKGGSQAYNTSGGTVAGTWSQPNHNHTATTSSNGSHIHKIRVYRGPGYSDRIYNSSGSAIDLNYANINDGGGGGYSIDIIQTTCDESGCYRFGVDTHDWYTDAEPDHNHTLTTSSNSTTPNYRPYAAVGTLQYPYV